REAHIAALHPDVVFKGGFAADDAITSTAAFDAQTPVVAWLDTDASHFSRVLERVAACVIAPGVEISQGSVPAPCERLSGEVETDTGKVLRLLEQASRAYALPREGSG